MSETLFLDYEIVQEKKKPHPKTQHNFQIQNFANSDDQSVACTTVLRCFERGVEEYGGEEDERICGENRTLRGQTSLFLLLFGGMGRRFLGQGGFFCFQLSWAILKRRPWGRGRRESRRKEKGENQTIKLDGK